MGNLSIDAAAGSVAESDPPASLDRGDGTRIACRFRPGGQPAILFLPGYASDMMGTKALALDDWAQRTGRALLRFDYGGTGESDGRFEAQSFARWRDDALMMVDASEGDLVLVGSSMGGWLMLLVALARPDRVRAMIGIAAAPDFSDWGYDEAQKLSILRDGRLETTTPYGTEVVSKVFWQSAEALRLTHAPIAIDCPVRLIAADADDVVPAWVQSRLAGLLRSADVQTIFVKGGDHRLSRPQDITLLLRTLDALLESL